MTFQRVLVATDFSSGSESALRVATRLAKLADAELVIAHAWEVPTALGTELPAPSDTVTELRNDALQGIDAARRQAEALGASRVSTMILEGEPSNAVVGAAADGLFDLVVVGTHGRTGLTRVLLGSIAEKIVRRSSCSVLVVRPTDEARPFTHVLCPIDFSESAQDAQRLAATLANAEHARLTLLNVVELTLYAGRKAVQYIQYLERSARGLLDKALAEVRASVPSAAARTATGSPGGQTLALLDQDPTIDLIVMGSHGRTRIKRVLFGSVAEKVVRYARCPVLVARARQASVGPDREP